ncbi:DNA GLYCOSYLASE SUPERFAMILY PROTEIN [Salix viminalis]|uniref:DNA GLYCOSYLASE SUPERFAMILY PROTEIN n=1 Tax=Salix viminalis TaxID=40686 RepID=A0A9Q0UHA9_SALVM|nr:DNA GLYCOSYLASE SUPERFAMILY PROTEIN [Salix viminalis]
MSGATKLHSAKKQVHEPPRAILGPTGNRARVLEEGRRKIEVLQKSQQKPKKPVEKMSQAAVKNNLSVDSTCSSDSSSSSSSGVSSSYRKNVKHYGTKKVKDVRNGGEIKDVSSKKEGPVKRCDWITPNSGVFEKTGESYLLEFESVNDFLFFSGVSGKWLVR